MTFPYVNPVLLGGVRGALFVGVTTRIGTGAVTFHADALVGDYAIIVGPQNSAYPLTGWTSALYTSASTNVGFNLHHKRLVAADLLSPPSVTASDTVHILVYRGPTAATVSAVTESAGAASTLDIAGIVKATNCRGIVNVVCDRGPATTAPGTKPAYMTSRSIANVVSIWCSSIADVLDKRDYTDSAVFPWTGFSTSSSYAQIGVSVQFT